MSLPYQVVTALKLLSSFLKWEVEPAFTRKTKTLLAGDGAVRSVKAGQLLGMIAAALEAASAAKTGGNTGNGTLTLDATTPVLSNAKAGVYTVRAIAAAADGGTFRVTDPDGDVIGDVAVGATFANHVKFVIADGAADFIVGDGFDITVAADDDADDIGKYVAWAPAAANGSEIAVAVVLADAQAEDGADGEVAVLDKGPAIVAQNELVWPDGVTDDQKAAAILSLAARGIDAQ